jgi:CBS domain containing-hemolysin-like protein
MFEALLGWVALVGPLLVAAAAALWAGLLAFAEEASLADTLHALGDAPGTGGRRIGAHRALHLGRLTLLVLGAVAATSALDAWGRPLPVALAWTGLTTAFLFVVADALPRAAARVAPELADAALPLARRTLWPFRPLAWAFDALDRRAGAAAPARPLQPALGVAERDMLLGVFTLADTTVDEVMTPRLDMTAVDQAASLDEVLATVRAGGHTRLPVYDGTPDQIVGVLFAKDLVPLTLGAAEPGARWRDLVRPAAFVPETKTLDRQLRDFQRGPAHLAVVVDEFGGTAGLVTLEDILEEIAGEIRDTTGRPEEAAIRREDDHYVVDGRVTLDDLSAAVGHRFTHPEVSTLGGLVYSVLGRVPRPGDELTVDGFRAVVERVDRRRVSRVRLERVP